MGTNCENTAYLVKPEPFLITSLTLLVFPGQGYEHNPPPHPGKFTPGHNPPDKIPRTESPRGRFFFIAKETHIQIQRQTYPKTQIYSDIHTVEKVLPTSQPCIPSS